MFNCADSNDMSKTEKSLLEDFKRFLQVQQEKQTIDIQNLNKNNANQVQLE